MTFWDKVLKALAALGGAVVGLMGGWTPLMTALCVFMTMDYLTGLLVAWRGRSDKTENGGMSSKASFDGLLRKALILAVILMAALLDHALDSEQAVFRTACVCYYIANEGLSILENMALMGVKIPTSVKNALELVGKKGDSNHSGTK